MAFPVVVRSRQAWFVIEFAKVDLAVVRCRGQIEFRQYHSCYPYKLE